MLCGYCPKSTSLLHLHFLREGLALATHPYGDGRGPCAPIAFALHPFPYSFYPQTHADGLLPGRGGRLLFFTITHTRQGTGLGGQVNEQCANPDETEQGYPLAYEPDCALLLGKGDVLRMSQPRDLKETLTRQAFCLVIELRDRPEAHGLLSKAIEVLKFLAQHGHTKAPTLFVSVRALRFPKA